jgi:hypothetical protein
MSYHSGVSYHPSIVTPGGMPMAGMPVAGMPVGTPYATPYGGNTLMMGGMGSEYGSPLVDSYPPMITRTPSLYDGRRSVYEEDLYDRDYRYGRDYYDRDYERGRRYYDDDDYYLRRSSSRASRRSSRRDYDDYYDRDYDRYDDRYYDSYRSPRYHSSRSYSSGYYVSLKVLNSSKVTYSDAFVFIAIFVFSLLFFLPITRGS